MNNKKTAIVGSSFAAMEVASVWFGTHFGGGFSSGRQIVQFYVRFGAYAIFMPIIAVAIMALVYYFAVSYAVTHKTFEYHSWALGFYEPIGKIGSVVYEIAYILILLTATAVVFATGGSVMEQTFHVPYLLSTVIIALLIFVVTIYGAEVVRKFSLAMSFSIVVIWVIVYVTAIAKNSSQLATVIATTGNFKNFNFWYVLWNALLYAGFQSCLIASWVAVADKLGTEKATMKAYLVYGFILNAAMLTLASIGILSFFPAVNKETVPSLYVATHIFNKNVGGTLISLVILLACLSTGVPIVYGGVKRIVAVLPEKFASGKSESQKNILPTIFYVILCWLIAQFGLIPLVAKGYGTLGYVGIFAIIIPVLLKGFLKAKKWWQGVE